MTDMGIMPVRLSELIRAAAKDARELDREAYAPSMGARLVRLANGVTLFSLAGAYAAGTLGYGAGDDWRKMTRLEATAISALQALEDGDLDDACAYSASVKYREHFDTPAAEQDALIGRYMDANAPVEKGYNDWESFDAFLERVEEFADDAERVHI